MISDSPQSLITVISQSFNYCSIYTQTIQYHSINLCIGLVIKTIIQSFDNHAMNNRSFNTIINSSSIYI